MTAPELVKRWRAIVNDNVMIGRDSHLIKDFLLNCNSVQMLLGFYRYEGQHTITIPIFLRQAELWLELDEAAAEIELCVLLTRKIPSEYLIWKELKDEQTNYAFMQAFAARQALREWTDRILA